jgi:hypothetical protein
MSIPFGIDLFPGVTIRSKDGLTRIDNYTVLISGIGNLGFDSYRLYEVKVFFRLFSLVYSLAPYVPLCDLQ